MSAHLACVRCAAFFNLLLPVNILFCSLQYRQSAAAHSLWRQYTVLRSWAANSCSLICLLTSAPVACREDLLRRALATTWDVLTSTEQPISAQIDQKVAPALLPRVGLAGNNNTGHAEPVDPCALSQQAHQRTLRGWKAWGAGHLLSWMASLEKLCFGVLEAVVKLFNKIKMCI